jgi:hypothetical protein
MRKTSLISQIQTERQNLENTLAKLSPKELVSSGAVGTWSAKDTLAHIAAWQQRLTDWLLDYTAGTEPQSPPPYGLEDEPLDQLNNQIYIEHCNKPLPEVLRFFQSTYQRTLETIKETPKELLGQTINFLGQADPQVWEIVAANTLEHDREHHDDILAWLNSEAGKRNHLI